MTYGTHDPAEVKRMIAEAREALADIDDPDHAWLIANGADVLDQLEAACAMISELEAMRILLTVERDAASTKNDQELTYIRELEQQAAELTAQLTASRERVGEESMRPRIKPDEAAYLASDRCESCGHLESLHNQHCCTFCMIPGCKCRWGEIQES